MPKPRVIDGGFFDDLDIAQLTRDERLLMIAIVSRCADDYGRLIAHPAYLRKQAFGYDEDISIDDVGVMLGHIIENCRNVLLYEVNGQEYICLLNWDKWQKIRYRVDSKLPPPPQIDGNLPTISCEGDVKVTENSPRVGLSRVEKGRVEVELSSGDKTAAASHLFSLLDKSGVLLNSMTAAAYKEILDETQDIHLLESAFEEAAKGNVRMSPKWLLTVVRRCNQDHCQPGEFRNPRGSPLKAEAVGVAAMRRGPVS